jgi:hypothetical protein
MGNQIQGNHTYKISLSQTHPSASNKWLSIVNIYSKTEYHMLDINNQAMKINRTRQTDRQMQMMFAGCSRVTQDMIMQPSS